MLTSVFPAFQSRTQEKWFSCIRQGPGKEHFYSVFRIEIKESEKELL